METVARVAAQRRRIAREPAEFHSVINCTFCLNSCAVSYFVHINTTSMPVLTHTPRQDACTESHRTFCLWKKNNTRLPAEKIQEPSDAALKSRRSLEREEGLNYKSRSFKQPCRLAGSFVWCLQKWITCFYKDGPHFGFVWLSLSLSHCKQNPSLACHQELSVQEESSWPAVVQEVTSQLNVTAVIIIFGHV